MSILDKIEIKFENDDPYWLGLYTLSLGILIYYESIGLGLITFGTGCILKPIGSFICEFFLRTKKENINPDTSVM